MELPGIPAFALDIPAGEEPGTKKAPHRGELSVRPKAKEAVRTLSQICGTASALGFGDC